MKYLISEEELKRIYLRGVYDGEQSESDFKNATVAFLKSKQPVEVLAKDIVKGFERFKPYYSKNDEASSKDIFDIPFSISFDDIGRRIYKKMEENKRYVIYLEEQWNIL